MTTPLFAGERLEHPSIQRIVAPHGGRITYAINAEFDREAASVLGRLVRIDLLEARNARRPAAFVLDLALAPYLDARILESLKRMTSFVLSEPGTRFEFANANEDLRAHLATAGFARLFNGLDANPPRRTPDLEL